MKLVRYSIYVVFLSFSLITYSCDSDINIFSLSDDAQLGADLDREIRSNPAEFPIYTRNPAVKQYIVNNIFNEILASPKIKNKNVFPYQMEIINSDSVLNAFALPGGYIYVYTGLLRYLDSEAALAGVLGHEIAHAEERHATNRMTQQYGVSVLLSLILGENPSQLAEIAANLFVGLGLLKNSRSDESESDELSFSYLQDSKFYPGGVKFFFEKLRDDGLVSSETSKIETFLSTHPDPINRITETNGRLSQSGLTIYNYNQSGNGIFRSEYQSNIKERL